MNDEANRISQSALNQKLLETLRAQLNIPSTAPALALDLRLHVHAMPTIVLRKRVDDGVDAETYVAMRELTADGLPQWRLYLNASGHEISLPPPQLPPRLAFDSMRFGPDDVLVVKLDDRISADTAARMADSLREHIGRPGQPVLVLGDGAQIGVLSPGGGPDDVSAQGAPATQALETIIERVMARVAPRLGVVHKQDVVHQQHFTVAGAINAQTREQVMAQLAVQSLPAAWNGAELSGPYVGPQQAAAPTAGVKPAVVGMDYATGADRTAIARAADDAGD